MLLMQLAVCLSALVKSAAAVPVDIPDNLYEGLPELVAYEPQQLPRIPLYDGERRCDNEYTMNGGKPGVLPCLARPWLPPFSYSTTEAWNGEYRRKRGVNFRKNIRAYIQELVFTENE